MRDPHYTEEGARKTAATFNETHPETGPHVARELFVREEGATVPASLPIIYPGAILHDAPELRASIDALTAELRAKRSGK